MLQRLIDEIDLFMPRSSLGQRCPWCEILIENRDQLRDPAHHGQGCALADALKEGLVDGFVRSFREVQELHHMIMVEKGFWDGPSRNTGELIALMHSELSEALEADRKNLMDDKVPEFSGMEAELADLILRVMDASEGLGLRVPEALLAKLKYNRTRPHKHGKNY